MTNTGHSDNDAAVASESDAQSNITTNKNSDSKREAQFLAAQQARLDKIRTNAEHNNFISSDGINNGNINIQKQRKELWALLKNIFSLLNSRLSALVGEEVEDAVAEDRNDNDDVGNDMNPFLYVTTQQRNEALEKLQEIQLTIRCLSHYTLQSNKFTSEEEKLLPEELVNFKMPDLPTADLRLLNIEFQKLKSKAQEVQDVIIPKEKFRFKRYRLALQKKKEAKLGMIGLHDDDDDDDSNNDVNNNNDKAGIDSDADAVKDSTDNNTQIKSPAHHFDGVTLVDKNNCFVKVQEGGQFTISDNSQITNTPTTPTPTSDAENVKESNVEAQAFLIRDLDSCTVVVDGTYSSIHIINTKNTTIQINTPIAGPTHVTNCHDTNITLSFCRQLRIHDCINVSFYIHVASGPIIEGCKGMKFYQCDYISHGKDDFEKEQNLYWDVKDFHWLKNLVKSPNFAVFTEEERMKEVQLQAQVSAAQELKNDATNLVQDEINVQDCSDDDSSDDDEL